MYVCTGFACGNNPAAGAGTEQAVIETHHRLAARSAAFARRCMGLALQPLAWLLRTLVRGYQYLVSPVLAPHCRYFPSCSEYALQALAQHGPLRGGWYAVRRVCRCHPWGGSGYDPVPPPAQSHGDHV